MMFFCLILLFAIVQPTHQDIDACNSTAVCGCSSSSATISRIVGGEDAANAAWGWTVSILIGSSNLCSGSILSSSWIITAAHCINDYLGAPITVYAGSNIRWSGTQNRTVSQTIVHPKFEPITFVNDIALLKLDSPLNMSDPNLSTICLPLVSLKTLALVDEWPEPDTSVVTVGWGRLSEGGALPIKLQQVTLQVIKYDASTCKVLIANTSVQFCAGVPGGGKDACQGDSGGPLMKHLENNQWVLVGLISSGRGCARATYSGVYTRVYVFKDWIESYTNESHWIDVDSHGNTVSISTAHLFLFVALNFFIILFQ